MDVETVFLNVDLEEVVCINIPVGYDVRKGFHCLRLSKAFYVLKQANKDIDTKLHSITQLLSENHFYMYTVGILTYALFLYMSMI